MVSLVSKKAAEQRGGGRRNLFFSPALVRFIKKLGNVVAASKLPLARLRDSPPCARVYLEQGGASTRQPWSSREGHERRGISVSAALVVGVVGATRRCLIAPLSLSLSFALSPSLRQTKLTAASACPGLARRSLVTAPPRRGEVRRALDMLCSSFFSFFESRERKVRERERARASLSLSPFSTFLLLLDEKKKRVKFLCLSPLLPPRHPLLGTLFASFHL